MTATDEIRGHGLGIRTNCEKCAMMTAMDDLSQMQIERLQRTIKGNDDYSMIREQLIEALRMRLNNWQIAAIAGWGCFILVTIAEIASHWK